MKKLTQIIENYVNDETRKYLYDNQARILLQREVHADIEYITQILGEVIRGDIEERMIGESDICVGLFMAVLDQIDFNDVAKPFIDGAVEDRRYAEDMRRTEEALIGAL